MLMPGIGIPPWSVVSGLGNCVSECLRKASRAAEYTRAPRHERSKDGRVLALPALDPGDHLASVLARGRSGWETIQHGGKLVDPLFGVDRADAGDRAPSAFGLADLEMRLRER